jgi:ribose transport system permease protein
MLAILFALAAFFALATIQEQQPEGVAAARTLERTLKSVEVRGTAVVIAARSGEEEELFAAALSRALAARGAAPMIVAGDPTQLRDAFARLAVAAPTRCLVTASASAAPIVRTALAALPALGRAPVWAPPPYRWPTFLLPSNLRNVANQIAVIAILAVGMTMVIITGGIDLSVGSLLAFAAVAVAWLIAHLGGESAGVVAMVAAGIATVLLCTLVGSFSGLMITRFKVPPFIATLALMQVASGIAYIVAQGKPIYQLPQHFVVLGRGTEPVLGVPYAVLLMAVLYAAAHLLMARTTLGRYIYAVGGNAEAARLAGVRVARVLVFAYATCGALAGVGGVITASQLRSGAPTYGLMYELYVIAAVVVGGTSLSGGEGRVLGTLVGAFIIAVIQNGMNLTHVESYTQKVVLGLVILLAVLLDQFRQRRSLSSTGADVAGA